MGVQMRIIDILNNLILEKWNPSNKSKHAACKAKVKSKVKVWPSAYASGQVVQCYYGKDNVEEETKMENLFRLVERKMTSTEKSMEKKLHKKVSKADFISQYGKDRGENIYYATMKKQAMSEDCGCGDSINEAKEGKAKKRGSPWFRHKDTEKIIPRKHPGRRYMSGDQQSKRTTIGNALIKKFKAKGGKLSDPAPNDPAKTMKEVLWATATRVAMGNIKRKPGTTKKKTTKKAKTKKISRAEKSARNLENIRGALKKIDAKRSEIKRKSE
jgi:hypothetical protein